jgi:hypothetical protein
MMLFCFRNQRLFNYACLLDATAPGISSRRVGLARSLQPEIFRA